jgi:hypothetical protein
VNGAASAGPGTRPLQALEFRRHRAPGALDEIAARQRAADERRKAEAERQQVAAVDRDP